MTEPEIELTDHAVHLTDQAQPVHLHHLQPALLPRPDRPPAGLSEPPHLAPPLEAALAQELQVGAVLTAVLSAPGQKIVRGCLCMRSLPWGTTV